MSAHEIEWHEERVEIIRDKLIRVRDKINFLRNEENRLSSMYNDYKQEIDEAKRRNLKKNLIGILMENKLDTFRKAFVKFINIECQTQNDYFEMFSTAISVTRQGSGILYSDMQKIIADELETKKIHEILAE